VIARLRSLARRIRAWTIRGDKPIEWLGPEEASLIPPRRLWLGPDDPIGHYFRWIWEYLAYLTLVAGLRREEAVLELGCGHGRTARGLLFYLRSPGRYVGLDIDHERLEDARARITRRSPDFQFVGLDVRSGHYNPDGALDAARCAFPFGDGEFDVVYAASLFTHLLPAEAVNYLRESRRVLKPGGRCLFSVFLLDRYRGPGTPTSPAYEFDHALPGFDGVAVKDPAHPDNAIAYTEKTLRDMARAAGLDVVRVIPGLWSESPGLAVNEQDLILLTPRS